MIHIVTPAMTVAIGRACPYCPRQFEAYDLVIEDDHPLRHLGCGPLDSWASYEDDDEGGDR